MRLALYTFGVFRERAGDPVNDGFKKREPANIAAVERSAGFIARSGYAGEPGPASWGEETYPRFYVERGDGWSPATLSLWESPEAAMAFSYFGIHAEALRHARDWFVERRWPGYVCWWTAGRPVWIDGVKRLEQLHDEGSRPDAFTFKLPFGPNGQSTEIDREQLRVLRDTNEAREENAARDGARSSAGS